MKNGQPNQEFDEQCNCPKCKTHRQEGNLHKEESKINSTDKKGVDDSIKKITARIIEVLQHKQECGLFIATGPAPGDDEMSRLALVTFGNKSDAFDMLVMAMGKDNNLTNTLIAAVAGHMAKTGSLGEALMLGAYLESQKES